MFTGLIEAIGTINGISSRGNYRVLDIEAPDFAGELTMGESVACDGACLTVVSHSSKSFVVEASQETSARTILNTYRKNARINLERAMKLGDRLGGHMVSGHIDTVGNLAGVSKIGESLELAVTFEPSYNDLVIEKGSVAINGISLTVNAVSNGSLTVNIIPHTAGATNILDMREGQPVNLEFDMIGKYILKMSGRESKEGLTRAKLHESGW